MLFVISEMAGHTHKRAERLRRDLPLFQLWLLDCSRWYMHFHFTLSFDEMMGVCILPLLESGVEDGHEGWNIY